MSRFRSFKNISKNSKYTVILLGSFVLFIIGVMLYIHHTNNESYAAPIDVPVYCDVAPEARVYLTNDDFTYQSWSNDYYYINNTGEETKILYIDDSLSFDDGAEIHFAQADDYGYGSFEIALCLDGNSDAFYNEHYPVTINNSGGIVIEGTGQEVINPDIVSRGGYDYYAYMFLLSNITYQGSEINVNYSENVIINNSNLVTSDGRLDVYDVYDFIMVNSYFQNFYTIVGVEDVRIENVQIQNTEYFMNQNDLYKVYISPNSFEVKNLNINDKIIMEFTNNDRYVTPSISDSNFESELKLVSTRSSSEKQVNIDNSSFINDNQGTVLGTSDVYLHLNEVDIINSGWCSRSQGVPNMESLSSSSFDWSHYEYSNSAVLLNGGAKISNSNFYNNCSTSSGGAIYIDDIYENNYSVENSEFVGNQSNAGGAISYITSSSSAEQGLLTIVNSDFNNNKAVGFAGGGAILMTEPYNMNVTDTTFNCNETNYFGGAVSLYNSIITTNTSTFTNNLVSGINPLNIGAGGAIYAVDSTNYEILDRSGLGPLYDIQIESHSSTFDNNIAGSLNAGTQGAGGAIFGNFGISGSISIDNNYAYIPSENSILPSNMMTDRIEVYEKLGENTRIGVSSIGLFDSAAFPAFSDNSYGYIEFEPLEKFVLDNDLKQDNSLVYEDVSQICNVDLSLDHIVTFEANGGSGAPENILVENDRYITEPSLKPTRDGYVFSGWSLDMFGNTMYNYSNPVTKSFKLYAVWEDEDSFYKMTYDANGGTNAPAPEYIEKGTLFNYPNSEPTRDGYEFTGWYTDASANSEFNFTAEVTSNMTVYAGWEKEDVYYKVSFNANGGTNPPSSQSVLEGELALEPDKEPTRSGYEFTGWYTDQNGKYRYNFGAKVNEGITLYAGWEEETVILPPVVEDTYYKITFNTNGGTNPPSSQSVKENEYATEPSKEPMREGYEFTGWYTDTNGNNEYNFSSKVTGNITLYAGWNKESVVVPPVTGDSYKVVFDANEGENAPEEQTVESGERAVLPTEEPTREGYEFTGWYLDEDMEEEYNFFDEVEKDLTLYAGWKEETIKITIVVDEEEDITEEKDIEDLEDYVPEKEGFEFVGWYIDPELTIKFDFEQDEVNESMTLYAKWLAINVDTDSSDASSGNAKGESSWAIINVALIVFSLIVSIIMANYFKNNVNGANKLIWVLFIPVVVMIGLFAILQDIMGEMLIYDIYSIIFAIIFVVQIVICVIIDKKTNKN